MLYDESSVRAPFRFFFLAASGKSQSLDVDVAPVINVEGGTAAGAAYSLSKLVTAFLPFILLPVLEDHGSTPVFVIVAVAMGLLVVTVGALGHRSTGRSADAV